jgi:hypothetical protein
MNSMALSKVLVSKVSSNSQDRDNDTQSAEKKRKMVRNVIWFGCSKVFEAINLRAAGGGFSGSWGTSSGSLLDLRLGLVSK